MNINQRLHGISLSRNSIAGRLHDLGFEVVARGHDVVSRASNEHGDNPEVGDLANLPAKFTCRGLHFTQERHVEDHLTEYHADTRLGLMYVNFIPEGGKIEIDVGLETEPGEEDVYVQTEDVNATTRFNVVLKKIESLIEDRLEQAED